MAGGDGLPWVWGVPVEPAGLPTPEVAPGSRLAVRAIAMEAPREVGFLWLCQMRRAPYSYDWLDNFGRRSPRQADPSLTDLAVGQSFMTIFELTDFTDSESLTLWMKAGRPTRIFGAITLHYRVETITGSRSQLVAALWMPPHWNHHHQALAEFYLSTTGWLGCRNQVLRHLQCQFQYRGCPERRYKLLDSELSRNLRNYVAW